jgi:hypothetical protein
MIQKIKGYFLPVIMMLTLIAPGLVPLAVSADVTNCNGGIANSVATGAAGAAGQGTNGNAVDCTATGVDNTSISALAKKVVTIISIVVGAVSVIMIIYGGFRYITSGGDSGRVGSAKNTLIYALVGLLIVALAQLLVHFVLNQADTITQPQP